MAKPMTPAQIISQMKKWHVPFRTIAGWETRGRPVSLGWGNLIMLVQHHTGSNDQSLAYLKWLFTVGRPAEGIPGPLAQFATGKDGVTTIGAAGRANHAGKGVAAVRDHVAKEDYAGYTSELKPGARGTIDGNALGYGNEALYSGAEAMTPLQRRGVILWACAILDFYQWTPLSEIAHREWTNAKVDPGKEAMYRLRADILDQLELGPDNLPPVPVPVPKVYDKMLPSSYFMGVVGPHVTWLGERLTRWGFGSYYLEGPGPLFTRADLFAVQAFQKKVFNITDPAEFLPGGDADGYPGLTSLNMLAGDPPPVPLPVTYVPMSFYLQNIKAEVPDPDLLSFPKRVPLIMAPIIKHLPDFVMFVEAGDFTVQKPLQDAMAKVGYARVTRAGQWRAVYRRVNTTDKVDGKLIVMSGHREPDGGTDIKHAHAGKLKTQKTQHGVVVVAGHLENENKYNDLRVQQADEMEKKTRAWNVEGWPMFFGCDTNSENMVREYFEDTKRYNDAYAVARVKVHGAFNTLNKCERIALNDYVHIDYIFTPKNFIVDLWEQVVNIQLGRYVGAFSSDHNGILVRGRLKI